MVEGDVVADTGVGAASPPALLAPIGSLGEPPAAGDFAAAGSGFARALRRRVLLLLMGRRVEGGRSLTRNS